MRSVVNVKVTEQLEIINRHKTNSVGASKIQTEANVRLQKHNKLVGELF